MLKYTLKQIVRNRSNMLVAMAIFFSALMLGVSGAYNRGVQNQVMELMRYGYTGDMTVVHNSVTFTQNPSPIHVKWSQALTDQDNALDRVSAHEGVKDVLKRLSLYATVMGEDESLNEYSLIMFVEFEKEKKYIFDRLVQVESGAALEADKAYISAKIAEKLRLKPGDSIYFFFIRESGFPVPARMTVGGIFQGKGYPALVDNMVYIDYSAAQKLLKLGSPVLTNANIILNDGYTDMFKNDDLQLPGEWQLVEPKESGSFFYGIYNVMAFFNNGGNIILLIVVFSFAFSVFLMNINKQRKMIFILNSLGLSHEKIREMYLLEGLVLGFFPALLGILVSLIIVLVTNISGIPAFNETMRYVFASDVLFFKTDIGAFLYALVGIPLLSLGAISIVLNKFLKENTLTRF